MIKHLLLAAGLLTAVPPTLRAADNVNLMPWVGGTEWASTSVEKNADGSYTVYVTDSWAGAGIDFAADHPDFSLDGYVGVRIDVTADNAGQKMVYVNYADDSDYDEYGNQGQAADYTFSQGKSVRKIVFKFENPGTYTMRAFTLLAPYDSEPQEILSGTWAMSDNGNWGAYHHVDASYFAGVSAGENLLIYYTTSGKSDPQAQIYAPKKEGRVDANSASESCHLYTTVTNNGIYADLIGKPNPLDIKLTEEMVKYLKLYGLSFEGHDVTFTKISLRKGNSTVDVEEMPEPTVDPVNPGDGSLGGTPIGLAPKGDLHKLFDGNAATTYKASRADRAWAGLDLGKQYVIKKVRWMAAPDCESRYVNLGIFEGANDPDFTDAIPFHIIRHTSGNGQWDEAEVSCSRGFRYVRYVGPRPLIETRGNGAQFDGYPENSTSVMQGSHAYLAELRFFGEEGAGDDSDLYRLTGNIPTVVINTVGMREPLDKVADPDKEADLVATLSIIDINGDILTAPGITRERGNYSRSFPKRPLRMKFDKKQKPLKAALGKAKKWELLNNYGDKTLLRNLVAFDIARALGMEYVPFCTPVDVVLNGEYRGCYQLADNKEIRDFRVNITEMDGETENWADPEVVTGGYFLEIDAYADQEPAGTWFTSSDGYNIPVTMKSPEDKDAQMGGAGEPLKYISKYVNDLTSRVYNGKFTGEGNYREIFDVESFLQLLMTNEIAGNKDEMWSFNMYKDRNDPHIYSGPAWDFDVAFNNSQYINSQAYENGNTFFYKISPSVAGDFQSFTDKVMSDQTTREELVHLWGAARDNGLSKEFLHQRVDYWVGLMGDAVDLNFERWPIMGNPIHDAGWGYSNYEEAVNHVKDFIDKIVDHFDGVIGYQSGQHVNELSVSEDDGMDVYRLTLGTNYGKLMVKDVVVASTPAQSPLKAGAVDLKTGFVNAGNEWTIRKSEVAEMHEVTFYAKHAGRTSEVKTVYIDSDGVLSGVENVAEENTAAPKEYYSLTGVRVNPGDVSPGVYVCRQGSRVTKVVLR